MACSATATGLVHVPFATMQEFTMLGARPMTLQLRRALHYTSIRFGFAQTSWRGARIKKKLGLEHFVEFRLILLSL